MCFKKKATKTKAVAYYRQTAEDLQEYSISIQREQVKKFAKEHGIEIINEFQDLDKSGLINEKHNEVNTKFKKILNDTNFKHILLHEIKAAPGEKVYIMLISYKED